MSQNLFLHLTAKQAWEDALNVGVYSLSTKGKTLEQVGFIHGSFPDQVEEVAGFVFAGSTEELVVLHLDIERLEAKGLEVLIEDGGNGKMYPHIYGAIPCELVDQVVPAHMNADGHLIQK
jgi:uncharacterized protein (DUF952 family)